VNIEEYTAFCLALPAVDASFPFDEVTMVFKVAGKMFTAANIEPFERVNVKCDPEHALELREQFAGVLPGYHMNKNHWNTVLMDGSIPDRLIKEWITDSYHLVVKSLTKKQRAEHGL
jgi:predicted DNA-binding protein (MmcQ/YjbR family)